MTSESIQMPALIAAVLALVSIIIIPVIAMNDGFSNRQPPIAASDGTEGISCALPPALDVEESGNSPSAGPLPADLEKKTTLKMATFGLG